MFGEAVMRAVHEAAEVITGFDASTWDLVLIELLAPTEGDRVVRDNVADLGGVRLSRLLGARPRLWMPFPGVRMFHVLHERQRGKIIDFG
jgi:hypothetical protein